MHHHHRQTKIVATLGPSSDSLVQIHALVRAGVDVFRLNFSHGTQAEHRDRLAKIRAVEEQVGRPVAVLMDLQGPKIRVGVFADALVALEPGQPFRLDLDAAPGTSCRVQLPHPEVFESLSPGATLLLDDGRLRLRVANRGATFADCIVDVGGVLSNRKGVNLPDTLLRSSVMTDKDRDDLAFGLGLGVDWIALSFVQTAADVEELKALVRGRARVVAKIEKPQAIDNIEDIAQAADALMVARGDLAVELSFEDVPVLQRRIVETARRLGKPVIVATQMLESMTTLQVPTRAEASDVATAVYQGVDAVMLSAETASGGHGLAAVETMARIISRVEKEPRNASTTAIEPLRTAHSPPSGDVIGNALRSVSQSTRLAATVAYTTSGASALKLARERPLCSLIGVTPTLEVARWMNLVWGVIPHVCARARGMDDMLRMAQDAASACIPTSAGQQIAVVGGLPFGTPGSTNFLHVVAASAKAAEIRVEQAALADIG